MRKIAALAFAVALLSAAALTFGAAAGEAEGEKTLPGADWRDWHAGNEVASLPSLQRGARNFMAYCAGCHSLKYLRYSRMANDLKISETQLADYLIQPGDDKNKYIIASLAPTDGEAWFGKAPPDLSLIARAKGPDYVYKFLKTFYSEPKALTGVNNLALPSTAMPHVLSELQGVQSAVFKTGKNKGELEFAGFEAGVVGRLSAADYDAFVRDTVNFLAYVGEPSQLYRQSLGVWVVLFLLAFTGIAFKLKQEYWKDVK